MAPKSSNVPEYPPIALSSLSNGEKGLEPGVEKIVKQGGLGLITAAVFLAGEMAGSGVLALPAAMKGTGWMGLLLIVFFTINACFTGTRLGQCWIMLEERYEEFRGEVRDPYPAIAEKATGKFGRILSSISITLTLYGGGCVFIVLISQFTGSLVEAAGFKLGLCNWMVIVAIGLIPLTWMGTPKDFWFIAVGALITTVTACAIICISSIYTRSQSEEPLVLPPPSVLGFAKAFGSIMFAFAGASTFPTIQADMADRKKFPISASIAMLILFLIYFPMAASGYFSFGKDVQDNIVQSMENGWPRILVEVMLLLHLISAFPIITNPPAQFFEQLLGIPADFNWKRCVFRSLSVLGLLFIAETIPSFGAILDLVGASTVTLLTFVLPPYFYLRLADASRGSKIWKQRQVKTWERVYCWFLVGVGCLGGGIATYNAFKNIVSASFSKPCYLMEAGENVTISGGGH